MSKRLTPYEKVNNFIIKCYRIEVDKWNAGLPNNMQEWDNFLYDWKLIDEVASLRHDNAELRLYNEHLNEQLKRVMEVKYENN